MITVLRQILRALERIERLLADRPVVESHYHHHGYGPAPAAAPTWISPTLKPAYWQSYIVNSAGEISARV